MERQRLTMDRKLTYQFVMASVLVVAGLVLLFIGCFIQPKGEIHSSILVAFGEGCTFAGALIGVDYHYRYRSWERTRAERKDEDKDLDR